MKIVNCPGKGIYHKIIIGMIIMVLSLYCCLACSSENKKISENEAKEIASLALTQDIISDSYITTEFVKSIGPEGAWMVFFTDLIVSKEQLYTIGWDKNDPNTLFGLGDNFTTVLINVDASKGNILTKLTTSGPWLGPIPPDSKR